MLAGFYFLVGNLWIILAIILKTTEIYEDNLIIAATFIIGFIYIVIAEIRGNREEVEDD